MFEKLGLNNRIRRAAKKRAARDDTYSSEAGEKREFSEVEGSSFLELTRCVPTPAKVYAIWVATFLAQGGHIQCSMNLDYPEYGRMLMPTHWPEVMSIPRRFGAQAFELMILPDLLQTDRSKILRLPLSGEPDYRPGWEWGHTQAFTLQVFESGPYGLKAWTNMPDKVKMYPDVWSILQSSDFAESASNFAKKMTTRPKRSAIAP